MQTVEFVHFFALLTIAFLLIRGVEVLMRGTWVSQMFGATFG